MIIFSKKKLEELKDIVIKNDVEVCGIFSNNKIIILNYGNKDNVLFPINIEKLNLIMFHTHPLEKNYKNNLNSQWSLFHTGNDIYESLRRYFNNNQNVSNDMVVSKYYIVNLKIKAIKKINSNQVNILNIINEIEKLSIHDINIIYVETIGIDLFENNNLSKYDLDCLIIHNFDKFNINLNNYLNKTNYLKNVKLEFSLIHKY